MLIGIGEDGSRRRPLAAGEKGKCPVCDFAISSRCGEQIPWHWAHARGMTNEKCDIYFEESPWHMHWKLALAKGHLEQIEVVASISSGGGDVVSFRGDVVDGENTIVKLAGLPTGSVHDGTTMEEVENVFGHLPLFVWVLQSYTYADARAAGPVSRGVPVVVDCADGSDGTLAIYIPGAPRRTMARGAFFTDVERHGIRVAVLGTGAVRQSSAPAASVSIPFGTSDMPDDPNARAVLNVLNAKGEGTLAGAAGCLAGDSEIIVNRAGKGFRLPLSEVVRRFNGGVANGRVWDPTIPTMVQGLGDGGFGRQHRLEAAYASGVKRAFRVTVETGETLTGTVEHPFKTPGGAFVPLGDLWVGSEVLILRRPEPKGRTSKPKYRTIQLAKHPYAGTTRFRTTRFAGGPLRQSTQHRVPYHRVVKEAELSSLLMDEFVRRVRAGELGGLTFLDPGEVHVHHMDEDPTNNDPANLEVLSIADHHRQHDPGGHVLWRPVARRVMSIEDVGEIETFDLSISDGFPHNYTANGFVVHNTGKTSLLKQLHAAGPYKGNILQLAPTGRAARRLMEVTGRPASTVHSVLYGVPEEDPVTHELLWPEVKPIGEDGGLVAIDESSMIGSTLASDIRAAMNPRARLLWIGDPHQLPPVDDTVGVDLQHPDVLLEHVWRSSDGIMGLAHAILRSSTAQVMSGVIQLAHKKYPGVMRPEGWPANADELMMRDLGMGIEWPPGVLPAAAWRAETFRAGHDAMLITYRNEMRHRLNFGVRSYLGIDPQSFVESGEPRVRQGEVFLVKSNHRELGLVNGQILELVDCVDEQDTDLPHGHHLIRLRDTLDGRLYRAYFDHTSLGQESREFRQARREQSTAWYHRPMRSFTNRRWINQRNEGGPRRLLGPAGETAHLQMGYASTCHSAQGGEAKAVSISFTEWFRFRSDLEEMRAWWYTAVTRAKSSVVLWFPGALPT